MKITYTKNLENITAEMLAGFFVGWPNPPCPITHLAILQKSYRAFVAIDEECNQVVGFINAVSDGVLSAYIPLLEVVVSHQKKGIGMELLRRMLAECQDLYMVDICHDVELKPYYARFDAMESCGSIFRNYDAQSGKANANRL